MRTIVEEPEYAASKGRLFGTPEEADEQMRPFENAIARESDYTLGCYWPVEPDMLATLARPQARREPLIVLFTLPRNTQVLLRELTPAAIEAAPAARAA